MILLLFACSSHTVCFGDCVDPGYAPGDYEGTVSAVIEGEHIHSCEDKPVWLEVDDDGVVQGEAFCDIWDPDDFGGPLTGRVEHWTTSLLWAASMDIGGETYTWNIQIPCSQTQDTLTGAFSYDSEWLLVYDGVLEAHKL